MSKFWYHKIDLGDEVTPGHHPFSPDAYKIPDDLTGKRVLDVGAWDGYWTFEALKRGAKEAVAIDNWTDMPWMESEKRVEWDTFDYCKQKLGYTDEQCKRYTMDVYEVAKLGKFDIVFFFGAIYHCRYPMLALDKLSEVCLDEIYIESAICDQYSPYTDKVGDGHGDKIVMEFYPTDQLGGVGSNWWAPTMSCLQYMVLASGFQDIEAWKYNNPTDVYLCRGFVKGKK